MLSRRGKGRLRKVIKMDRRGEREGAQGGRQEVNEGVFYAYMLLVLCVVVLLRSLSPCLLSVKEIRFVEKRRVR